MQQLLDDLEATVDTLPVDMHVTADALDESNLPSVIAERQAVQNVDTSPISIAGNSEATIYLAFQNDIHWDDIQQVAAAFLQAYKTQAPASDLQRIEQGRGASGIKLVELRIRTGFGLDLDELPTDFRFKY